MAQIIPLTSISGQQLSVSLNINGGTTQLQLIVRYNAMGGFWVMSIADVNGVPLLGTVPLLTGSYPAGNILAPYQYMGIGSAYVLNVTGTAVDYPNATNLGTDFALLWDDNAGYVAGQTVPNDMTGPAGPPGPQGLPGVVGGFYFMGASGSLIPSPGNSQWTQVAGASASLPYMTGAVTIEAPVPSLAGATFLVKLIQPTGGGIPVTWSSFYKCISGFDLDTTGSTQACLLFQINAGNTAAEMIQVAQNGWSIV